MDNETHYLTYDSEEIYREMQYAYIDAGGDALYPGDEKEMLLRSVLAVIVQAFAGVDNALRMGTLRYAVGDYLDLLGEKKNCYRIEERAAKAKIEITFSATGISQIIPEGTQVTADGTRMYLLDETIYQEGFAQVIQATVTASDKGTIGNGLEEGTQMQFAKAYYGIENIVCIEGAFGGQNRETDDVYRERIRTFGLASVTTGPKDRYEAVAKSVTSEIIDARALNTGAGQVGIYLLLSSTEGSAAIIANVAKALNAKDTRPLTDSVTVQLASEKTYTLHALYQEESGSNIAAAVAAAVAEYQSWQDNQIGNAFNPDRLMAAIYRAGATRVSWGDGSEFDGGDVEYTEIPASAHCKGTIDIGVMA